jgi:hypothetical protein
MDTALRAKRSRQRSLLTRDARAMVPLYVTGTALGGPSLGTTHIHVGQHPSQTAPLMASSDYTLSLATSYRKLSPGGFLGPVE